MAQILKKLPRTSTLGIDYENIKQDVREIIQEDPRYNKTWDDFLESSVGSLLLEMYAWIADQLASRIDWFTNENFISTAKEKESVIRLLKLIGYKLKLGYASEAVVDVSFVSQVSTKTRFAETISRGYVASSKTLNFKTISAIDRDGNATTFEAISYSPETQTYNYNDSVIININNASSREEDKSAKVYFLQGKTNMQIITIDKAENYKLVLSSVPVIQNSIKIYRLNNANSILYEIPEVDSFIDRRAQESAFAANLQIRDVPYIRNIEKDDTVTIEFGNSVLLPEERLPIVGEKYLVIYRTGGGVSGNINRRSLNFIETKTDPTDSNIVTITYQNLEEGQRGLDPEDYLRAAEYGPVSLRSVEKAVTVEDYAVLLSRFENVLLSASYGEQNLPVNFFERYGEYVSPMDVWNFVAMNNSRWETLNRSDYKNFRWAKLNLENNFNNVIQFSTGETNVEVSLRTIVYSRSVSKKVTPVGSTKIIPNAIQIGNSTEILKFKSSLITATRFYYDVDLKRVFLEDYEEPPVDVLPEDVQVFFYPNIEFLATFNKFSNVYRIKKYVNDYFDLTEVPYLDFKEYYSLNVTEEDLTTLSDVDLYNFISEREFKVEEEINAFIFTKNKVIDSTSYITIPSSNFIPINNGLIPAIELSVDNRANIIIPLLDDDTSRSEIIAAGNPVLSKTEISGERRINLASFVSYVNSEISGQYSQQNFNSFLLEKNILDVASYISELQDQNSDIILKIPFTLTRISDSAVEEKELAITVGRTFNWKFLLEKINDPLGTLATTTFSGSPVNIVARFSPGDFGSTDFIQFIAFDEGYEITFNDTADALYTFDESFYRKLDFTTNSTLIENFSYDTIARIIPAADTEDKIDRVILESPLKGINSNITIYEITNTTTYYNAAFDIFSVASGVCYGTRGIVLDLSIDSNNFTFDTNPVVGEEIVSDWGNVGDLIYYNGSVVKDYRRNSLMYLNFISSSDDTYRLGEYYANFSQDNPLYREKNNFVYDTFIVSEATGPKVDFDNSNIILRFTENEISQNSIYVIDNLFKNTDVTSSDDYVEIDIRESDYPSFSINFTDIFSQITGSIVPLAETTLNFLAYDDYDFSITVTSSVDLNDTTDLETFAGEINAELTNFFLISYPDKDVIDFTFATVDVENKSLVFKSSDKKRDGRIIISGTSALLNYQTVDFFNSVSITPPDNYEDPQIFIDPNFDIKESTEWFANFGPGKIPYPTKLEYYVSGDYAIDFIEEEVENSSYKDYTTVLIKTNNPNNRFPDRKFFVHYVSDYRFFGETEGSTNISLRTVDLSQFGIQPRKDSDEDLLNNYFLDKKIIGVQNRWKSPLFSTFDIVGDVYLSRSFPAEEVKRQVEEVLYDKYSITNATLGMLVSKQEVSDTIRTVPGVIFSNIVYLGRDSRNEYVFNLDGTVRTESQIDTKFIVATSISSNFDEALVMNDTVIERNRVVSGINLRYIVQ